MRVPSYLFGMIFAGVVLLAGCGGDAATAIPPTVSSPTVEAPAPELRPLTEETLAQFAAYIEETRGLFNVPGMAVVVVQGGEVAFAQGFGVTEAGGTTPVTPDTLFDIGSTSKAMTTMMAATLVDEGLIAWDTPVVEVMPKFQLSDADATSQITLRHLFAHTTGLPDTDLALLFANLSPEGIVEFLKDVPLSAPPGESRTYQNEAFAIGGYVAAMAAGGEYDSNLLETYIDLMQTRVFDPIGMSTATFSMEETEANPNRATPHFTTLNATLLETGFDVTPTHYWDIGALAPTGALRASALDVGRFLMTMLSDGVAPDGTRVVTGETLLETWTQQIGMSADPWLESAGSGLGWNLEHYQGITVATKDGSSIGFTAQIAFIPGSDTGIVVLSNLDFPVAAVSVQWRLVEMLYGLEPRLEESIVLGIGQFFEGASDGYSRLLPVDPESVAPYLGEYESAGDSYIFELRDGELWLSWGSLDTVQLLASPEGGYVTISPNGFYMPFHFVEREDGGINVVIAGEIETPKLNPVTGN